MRPLSAGEIAALRLVDSGRPIRHRYTPRGSSWTVLPSQTAILEARDLVTYSPRTETYTITDDGRALLDRLTQGAKR